MLWAEFVKYTSVVPKGPTAFNRSLGGALSRGALPSGGGGLPMIDNFSHDGSNSERASLSQEDWNSMSNHSDLETKDTRP